MMNTSSAEKKRRLKEAGKGGPKTGAWQSRLPPSFRKPRDQKVQVSGRNKNSGDTFTDL